MNRADASDKAAMGCAFLAIAVLVIFGAVIGILAGAWIVKGIWWLWGVTF